MILLSIKHFIIYFIETLYKINHPLQILQISSNSKTILTQLSTKEIKETGRWSSSTSVNMMDVGRNSWELGISSITFACTSENDHLHASSVERVSLREETWESIFSSTTFQLLLKEESTSEHIANLASLKDTTLE